MKRTVVISAFVVTTIFLFVSCRQKNNIENNLKTTLKDKKMQRIKTASGLEYEILQEGTGVCPSKGRFITVHYTGWINEKGNPGRQFDSSLKREPFSFYIGVGHVIKGWDEGVMTMKVGEKRRLFIPSNLGYGSQGAGSSIPPHTDLIFDVELLNIHP